MKTKVIAEVSIIPIGTATTSVSSYVAACVGILQNASDVKYQLTAMGTIMEGPLDSILAVVKKMHEAPFNAGAQRVVTTLKIDDRRDKAASIESKVKAVDKKLKLHQGKTNCHCEAPASGRPKPSP